MSKRFNAFFLLNFLIFTSNLVITCFEMILIRVKLTEHLILADCMNLVSGLIWFCLCVVGCSYRWDHNGKVCSGDFVDFGAEGPYLFKAGRFISIYLTFVLTVLGVIWCIILTLGSVCCISCTKNRCCGRKDDNYVLKRKNTLDEIEYIDLKLS